MWNLNFNAGLFKVGNLSEKANVDVKSAGGSGTTYYYHSCGDDVADIIAENGFRTDIPNPQVAFNNNRY